jgi:ribosomal-protein-alanine N-acetyltransferase
MRPLKTERLRLTPVTVQNAGTLWNVLQQPDLRTYQELPSVGAVAFASMVAKRPRALKPGATGRFEWLIYVNRIRKPVGWVSLRIAERDLSAGEIGYSVVREFRNRGVAGEAVRSLIDEAFLQAGLVRITAYCLPENRPSQRVLERLDFAREGVLAHGATVNGRVLDVLVYALDRIHWAQSGNSMVMPASAYPA